MVRCSGPDSAGCGALVTCAICDHCEDHCLTGGSGACARASWPADEVAAAMVELARENELQRCEVCGGLEDQARPHRRCRVRVV